MHRFALHNDSIREASANVLSPGQVGLLSGWGVFSTIRVMDGVLFAWERHWARMKRDAETLRVPFPEDSAEVQRLLLELVRANGAASATMRVVVVRNKGGMWEGSGISREFDLVAFTTGLKSWGSGAKLGVVRQARHSGCSFAGTKILAWAMNLAWLEEAQSNGFDEVILLNEHDAVSECTSANIFAAKGGNVWTPPLSSGCLPGVTRELLLSEIRIPGVKVTEKDLRLEDLAEADQVFITSTTRDLLPVLSVEGVPLRQADGPRADLEKAFAAYSTEYVKRQKEFLLASKPG